MRWVILLLAFTAADAFGAEPADERGYVALFNGRDLDGWQLRRADRKGYVVEKGLLVCPADGGGFLFTDKEYADFSLRFEFRLSKGANNGVAIRCPLVDQRPAYEGIEIQILDNVGYPKKLRPTQYHGSIYDLVPAKRGALKPVGEWNQQEIICRGRRITVIVNETVILDASLDDITDEEVLKKHPGLKRTTGHIGLLGHGSRVEFRNIRIKEFKGVAEGVRLRDRTLTSPATQKTWQAGAAAVKITPREAVWMAGYGSRAKPSQGVEHDLWAKALAIEDPAGKQAVLVTMDLVGIDRTTSAAVCEAIAKKHGLNRDQLVLNCSHNHCGPVVGRNLAGMLYFLEETDRRKIELYTTWLQEQLVAVVGKSLRELAPATLAYADGHCDVAVNRRHNPHDDVVALRQRGGLRGPVDHSVPVLRVSDGQGRITAIVFGYACHPTKLTNFYRFCGDYVGFARLHVEKAHPGAVAMFWQGCGGDQTPWPRGGDDVRATEAVGRTLADAVNETLAGEFTPIKGRLATSYREIELSLGALPSRDEIESMTKSRNRYKARHATQLLATLDAGRKPVESYAAYPVQVYRLGSDVLFIALGGEVVVDYAVRLKDELAAESTWVAGYSNDVMAYIPSRRVLAEGGYEGATSMIYYGLPAPWATGIEEKIVKAVKSQVRSLSEQANRDKESK